MSFSNRVPDVHGEGWRFEVTEWWDSLERNHQGSPSIGSLGNAIGLTGHIIYDDGTEKWGRFYAPFGEGWTLGELEVEALDWAEYGTP